MYPSEPDDFSIDPARREVLEEHARYIAEHHLTDIPFTAAEMFRPPADMTPAQGIGLLALILLVVLSSFAGSALLAWLGVRGVALVMLVPALAVAIGMRGVPSRSGLSVIERAIMLLTLTLAVATGSQAALMLLPAIVHASVARLMLASVQGADSLIYAAARIAHPLAPDFIRPYCSKLTLVWAAMFAGSAAITAALAVGGTRQSWQAWCGWQFWSLLTVFVVAEFFWRKAWFRYFGKGPFDRLLERLLPPGKTARGRRSVAYVKRMRAELARLAEEHRAAAGPR